MGWFTQHNNGFLGPLNRHMRMPLPLPAHTMWERWSQRQQWTFWETSQIASRRSWLNWWGYWAVIQIVMRAGKIKNYFTSSDPHHDIYTFCYWQIFWHCIWHISIWHIFSHSTWHIFWHMFWHTLWHSIWHSIWHILWHIFWHPIPIWHSIWQIFGILSGKHSGPLSGIPCGILSGISELILSGISSGILSGIVLSSGILSDMLCGVLSGISSGILSGRWGPVVLTELGRSQAEVQRCSLSSEGPRLRSSGPLLSHAGSWGPAVPTACGSWRRVGKADGSWGPAVPTACGSSRRVGKAEVGMEVDAKVVEEKLEEREEEK